MAEQQEQSEKHLSRSARLVGRFVRRSWQAITVGLLVVALGVLAFLSPGLVQADVHLDEGTVYAAKRDTGLIGSVNAQIDELAAATAVGDSEFAILQDEDLVLVHGLRSSTLVQYNPARNRMESPVQLPSDADVQLAGGTLLVVNSDNGRVWYGGPETVLAYDFQKQKADLEVGEFGAATLTASGAVIGLDVDRSVLVRRSGAESTVETALPFTLSGDIGSVALSAVGDQAVVLDRQSGRIWVEGTDDVFEVSGASTAELVPAAPDALGGQDNADAIYATQAGLIALTPDGPRSLSGQLDGAPVQPVQVHDCVYAVFGEQFVKQCRGAEPLVRDIPGLGGDPLLSFIVNRSTVALNDAANGTIWMVDKDMLRITDWERVVPPQDDEVDDIQQTETIIPPDRSQPNQDPIAQDDTLAARAGRSTILTVLDNDTDPDGDVLTVSAPAELTGATLQTVRGGSGLQITVDLETTGTLTFSYTVDDGRGGKDSANVTVRVLPADPNLENNAPFKHSLAQPITIQLGQTVTKRVLLDWRDPEGDSLILVDAWLPPEAEDEVSFTPDGQVTFLDIGKTTGTKTVNVRVSDGYAESEGEMVVVVTDDTVAPIAYGDFETATAGKTVTIDPLANDVGANLALTEIEVAEDCGCVTKPNYREGWFTFNAETPGTYYVTYKVSNGPIALGLVRIDVRAETTDHAPVAALDVALLPPGGSVVVDPVLNDTDEDGDVLVVQSVSQQPGLQVVLERRHLVTITAQHTPEAPVTLNYRLSDGKHSVLGTIIVIPTPTTGSVQPLAERDEVRVRAGSTQAVNVLANDSSPIGLALTLDELVENPLEDRAWIDGQFINVSVPAGAQAANTNLTYQIRDADGAIASTQLRVTIVSEDAQNEPPVPRQVVERVLAGTTSRLAIPLEGIDPNGDAVRLVGLGSGPQLGRVLATGDGWMSYEAFPSSEGTDVFEYQVIDAFGAIGTGEIRVGVAPAGPDNSAPTGVPDEIRTRPGRHVQIPALRNDVDVDGDGIGYTASDPVEIDGIPDVEVVEDREITFLAPEEPGTYVGKYYIEDSRGASGSGDLTVVVDPEAPLLAPETRDDLVSVSAVIGKDWVEVDALANDFDPDGPREELTISVPTDGVPEEEAARPSDDGRMVTAPVTDRMQQIRYVVTDAEGNSDIGLILLPGRNDSVPVLRDPDYVLEAVAGQPSPIDINGLVAGTAGRTVRLTGVDSVSATHGRALPGAQRIEYTPDLAYEGPASVVFEVADVVAEGDKSAKRAYVSVPVKVLPAPNRPDGGADEIETAKSSPELIGSQPHLLVGPGEGDARIDLMPLFRDPDGDSFYFDNFAHSEGDQSIEWNVSGDGSKLYASTAVDTPPGTRRTISAEVIDASNARTPFTIQLEVTSSTRPLATAVTDVVDEAIAGSEFPVAVLLNDKSNLLTDQSLTLVPGSARVINGAGTASTDGDSVVIRPADGFVGTLTASYTIEDATKDPNRRVDGTIRVTVKDVPSRPGAPRDGVAGNGQVTFTYTPGSSNGFEIMSRNVVAINASGATVASTQCPSTTCTVTGLPNGQPYQFQVVEVNQAGASDPSPLSAPYTPDVKPNAPAAPIVAFGDQQLIVNWSPPTWENPSNPGSPVDRYTLALLDEAGNQVDQRTGLAPSPTTFTWTGLTNGTRYRFKILAGNKAGESPYSEASAVNWPAAPPSAPPSIVATATENPLGGAFEVAWAAAGIEPNGDPVTEFLVTPIGQSGPRTDFAKVVPVNGAATQTVLVEGLGQVPYKFQVTARNKAGHGAAATTPNWQTAFELPKVTSFTANAGDGSIQMYTDTNFDGRQEAQPRLQYRLNGGGWQAYPRGGLLSGLTNGRFYDVEVRLLIVGDKASEPARHDDVMPRSARPILPTYQAGSLRNLGWEDGYNVRSGYYVSMTNPTSLEATGGWDPDRLQHKCAVANEWNACSPDGWTGSHDFIVDYDAVEDGATIAFGARHLDAEGYEAADSVSVPKPMDGSWDNETKRLVFTVPHVSGGLTCRATFNDGITETWTTGSFDKTFPTEPAEPPEGSGPWVDTRNVDITCSNSNFSNGADSVTLRSGR